MTFDMADQTCLIVTSSGGDYRTCVDAGILFETGVGLERIRSRVKNWHVWVVVPVFGPHTRCGVRVSVSAHTNSLLRPAV